MLQADPYKRISAQQALNHPWLNQPKMVYRMDEEEFRSYIESEKEYFQSNYTQNILESDADRSHSISQ